MRHTGLWLTSLTPEQHARTCNYWYTVTERHMAHTAFTTRNALEQWLSERGLKMTAELPAHGECSTQHLEGEYSTEMHGSYDAFYALPAIFETKTLSNGDYTLARVTEDESGHRTVHTLNPNCHHRPVFDYRACHEMYC